MALGLVLSCLFLSETAYGQSQRLTTTIVVTVRAVPQTNLLPDDTNAGIVHTLATDQPMSQPHIRVTSGVEEKVYTIIDRL